MKLRPDPNLADAMARNDFTSFATKCFETLNPGKTLKVNWHIEAQAFALEQVWRGTINRLIINLPSRSLKSTLASIAFPAFLLGHDPTLRIIVISYSASLAVQLSNEFRAIITADWYRKLFPKTKISRAKNNEYEVATTVRGFRLATSIDGTLTGRGGDIIIIDDPLKADEAGSESRRQQVNDFFYNTVMSRLDDQINGVIILAMQRLHDDDLTGALLRKSSQAWNLLKFPAIAEQEERIQIGAGKFYTRRLGDALDPERAPRHFLESRRDEIGPHIFAAQYQQDPVPPGGDIIKPEWVQRYDQLPAREPSSYYFESWDTATKVGDQNDYSVCTTWLYQDKKYYLVHVLRGRFDYPTLKERAISHAHTYKPKTVLVEDAGIGEALIDELKKAGFSAIPIKPVHDKRTRMSIQAGKFHSGRVFFPTKAPWLAELENELFAFPNGRHDDQVDSISQALAYEVSGYNLAGFARRDFSFAEHYGIWW